MRASRFHNPLDRLVSRFKKKLIQQACNLMPLWLVEDSETDCEFEGFHKGRAVI